MLDPGCPSAAARFVPCTLRLPQCRKGPGSMAGDHPQNDLACFQATRATVDSMHNVMRLEGMGRRTSRASNFVLRHSYIHFCLGLHRACSCFRLPGPCFACRVFVCFVLICSPVSPSIFTCFFPSFSLALPLLTSTSHLLSPLFPPHHRRSLLAHSLN